MCQLQHAFLLAILIDNLPRVVAIPPDPVIIIDNDHVVRLADPPAYRTATVVLCLVYAILLASAQGESLRANTKWLCIPGVSDSNEAIELAEWRAGKQKRACLMYWSSPKASFVSRSFLLWA
jgi:hypothetical protein